MAGIDVIAFDYYGTLQDVRTDEAEERAWLVLANFMRYHGAAYTPKGLRQAYHRLFAAELKRLHQPDFTPEPDGFQVLRQLYAAKGAMADDTLLHTTAEVQRAACTAYFRLYPGTMEMLAALKNAGKRLALLSNAQSGFTRPEMHAVGIESAFDQVFLSSECGAAKPCRAFYQQLIDWAQVPPERIMMVGNNPFDDVIPARVMGLRTCYVRSKLTPKGAPMPECDLYLPKPDMKRLTSLLLKG